jgi:hypothetical protein
MEIDGGVKDLYFIVTLGPLLLGPLRGKMLNSSKNAQPNHLTHIRAKDSDYHHTTINFPVTDFGGHV